MLSGGNALEPAPLQYGPARYEAVIRLGEAIRSHPDEKDLFRTIVNELHEVVEFDVLCQFDGLPIGSSGILPSLITASWRRAV